MTDRTTYDIVTAIQAATFQITGTVAVFFGENITQYTGIFVFIMGMILSVRVMNRAAKRGNNVRS